MAAFMMSTSWASDCGRTLRPSRSMTPEHWISEWGGQSRALSKQELRTLRESLKASEVLKDLSLPYKGLLIFSSRFDDEGTVTIDRNPGRRASLELLEYAASRRQKENFDWLWSHLYMNQRGRSVSLAEGATLGVKDLVWAFPKAAKLVDVLFFFNRPSAYLERSAGRLSYLLYFYNNKFKIK